MGITGPRLHSAQVDGTPVNLYDIRIDAYYVSYSDAVTGAGGLPVHVTQAADPFELVGRLDGLLISGGQDVDPRFYGKEATTTSPLLDPGRDAFELGLIEAALTRKVPLLGICRGAQLMNIARGGTLIMDLGPVQGVKHDNAGIFPIEALVHGVSSRSGSIVGDIYGASFNVNSFHHQAIADVGDDVIVTGTAPDGIVEAIEIEASDLALGVQWHPETLTGVDPVFDWLIERAMQAKTTRHAVASA